MIMMINYLFYSPTCGRRGAVLISDSGWVLSGHVGTTLEEKYCGGFLFQCCCAANI